MDNSLSAGEASWLAVGDEISGALAALDPAAFATLVAVFRVPVRRWFFSGQGRSGLVARMAATRFMHAGFASHFVGEATAPSPSPKAPRLCSRAACCPSTTRPGSSGRA